MLRHLAQASAVCAILTLCMPTAALAHTHHRHHHQSASYHAPVKRCHGAATKGTVIGAVGGGVLGGVVTHSTTGAVVGAGVGALAGHQIAKSHCKHS